MLLLFPYELPFLCNLFSQQNKSYIFRTDLAEDDRWGVNPLVMHAIKIRHQYRVCHKQYPGIVRKCHHKIAHFKRVYHHLKRKVHGARHVLRKWVHKYRHCLKFCWWRRRRHGDEIQQIVQE